MVEALQRPARERLLGGLAVTGRMLDVGGVATSVLEGGHGPAVMLLHGGSQVGGVMWGRVIPRLLDSRRLVVPDLPGLGESEPVDRLNPSVFTQWLHRLLQLTCDDRPTLVAHSLPAALAIRFAADHGHFLRRLVVVGSPALGSSRPPPALLFAALRLNLQPSRRNLERFNRWPYHEPEGIRSGDADWHDTLDDYLLSRATVPHVKRTMRQLVKAGMGKIPDSELQRITAGVALLWGRRDRMAPLDVAQAASDEFDWPLHVIENAGHLPHVEQPAAFVDALDEACRVV